MNAADWFDRTSDRLNPVVVKEMWQNLRARLFWVPFAGLLVACVGVSVFAFLAHEEGGRPRGAEYLFAFLVGLLVVHFLVVPLAAHRSMAREQERETWVLLTITGIGTKRIVRGKIATFLLLAGLYGSAVGPFLVLSYFLEGVELTRIGLALALDGAGLVLLTTLAVAAATLGSRRIGRTFWSFAVLLGLLAALAGGVAAAGLLAFGRSAAEVVFAVGLLAWAALGFGIFAYQSASARLMLPTENTARGPRLAFLAQVGLTAAAGVVALLHPSHSKGGEYVTVVLAILDLALLGVFVTTGLCVATERDRDGRPPWGRSFSLLSPGGVNGFRLVLLLLIAVGVLTALLPRLLLADSEKAAALGNAAQAGFAYLGAYLSAAVLLGRAHPWRSLAGPGGVRGLFFGLAAALGLLVPLLLRALRENPASHWLGLLGPYLGVFRALQRESERGIAVVTVVAALLALAADRVLVHRHQHPRGPG